ncbi:MAG: nuclear transport factor 2 family protein [Bradyrhizobium sp.]
MIGVNPELSAFIARIDAAQEEFAHGRPGDFKSLWAHTDDVTLAGGLGGLVEVGWAKVGARLDWASSNYAEGERSNETIGSLVGGDLAYLVRREIIEGKISGARSTQELRVTMVFRRDSDGWRIVHRHADSQIGVSGSRP